MSRERRESEPWAAPPHCNSSRPNVVLTYQPAAAVNLDAPHPVARTAESSRRPTPPTRRPTPAPGATYLAPARPQASLPPSLRLRATGRCPPRCAPGSRRSGSPPCPSSSGTTSSACSPRTSTAPHPAPPRPPHRTALCISPHRTPPRTPHPAPQDISLALAVVDPDPACASASDDAKAPPSPPLPPPDPLAPPSLLAATFPRTRMPHRRPPRRQGAAGVRGRGDGARAARQRGARRGAARHRLLAAAPRRDGRQRVPLRPAGRAALGQVSDRGAYSTPSEPPSEPPPRETPPRERRLPVTHGGRRPLAALCARVGLKHAPGRATHTHRWSASSAANLG